MLNEFRVHFCYGNLLNGHWLLSQWRILWMVIVKCQNVMLLLHVNLTWNFQHIERHTSKEMNHCWALIWISCQCSDSVRPDAELGNLLAVGCQAKVKNSDMHHCSTKPLKAVVSQSDFWYDCLCQFKGTLCQCFKHHHILTECTANHSEIRKPQSFSGYFLVVDLTLSLGLRFCLSQCCLKVLPSEKMEGNCS